MTYEDLLSDTLDQWYQNAWEKYCATPEYKTLQEKKRSLDELRKTALTQTQNQQVEHWLSEYLMVQDALAMAMYRHGAWDCLWLLNRVATGAGR